MALGLTFAFDASKETPQDVERRRKLAEAIMGRSLAPKNVGEGWNAIANGIVANVQNRRAAAGEAAGMAGANDLRSQFVNMLTGQSSFPPAPGASGSGAASSFQPTDQASARIAQAHGDDMSAYQNAIASIESAGSGDYGAIGPRHKTLGRALGKYQVMEANIGPWSEAALGRRVSADEFMQNPEIQDTIFNHRFGQYVNKYGPEGAAQAWFGGEGGVGKLNRQDVLGTTIGAYTDKFRNALGGTPVAAAPAPAPQNGLTPDALQAWAGNTYAPAPQNPAVNAVNALGNAEPVGVAETEADILAQEQAMMAQAPQAFQPSPGTAPRLGQPPMQPQQPVPAPPLAPPQYVQDYPVAGPQVPVQGAQAGGGFPEMAGNDPQRPAPPNFDLLMQIINNPFMDEGTRQLAASQVDQFMKQQDPRYGMQLEADKLGLEKSRLEIEAMRNPQPKDTDDIREYNYAVSQGYEGSFQQFMTDMKRAGATNVNLDTGTIPQGYEAIRDENGRVVRYQPIPGGPADTSEADAAAADSQEISTATITGAAQKARAALRGPGLPATGTVGKLLANLPESNAAEVRRQVAVMQATARIENLQAMRAASPTGGALGNVSDSEGAMLAAKSGALDPDSPTFERDLDDYERTLLRIVHGKQVGDAIFEQSREQEEWQDFGGVKIRRKQ